MLEAVHEIGIYIHRFHNLDLFQQGWYQINITMRWEGEDSGSFGTPVRVFQYEAPDLGSDDVYGVWRIDDTDHSFSTQPFRIRYTRQDVLLSMMVIFNLSSSKFEVQSTSTVILRFELLYTSGLESRNNIQDSLDDSDPAAIHEFRIPPKTLLGLHAYCPVHFDDFHAVLVDITVHVGLLKSAYTSSQKVPRKLVGVDECIRHQGEKAQSITNDNNVRIRAVGKNTKPRNQSYHFTLDPTANEDITKEHDKPEQVMSVMLGQTLLSARGILLKDLQNLSQAVNQPINIKEIVSNEIFGSVPRSDPEIPDPEVLGKFNNIFEVLKQYEELNGTSDFQSDVFLHALSEVKLLELIDLVGDQVLYLWGLFLNFHRVNVKKILDFLRYQWAVDRKAEWSLWMIYTKVKMSHQPSDSSVDESSYSELHGRPAIIPKITGDPAENAAKRAGLHRQSIAKMMVSPIKEGNDVVLGRKYGWYSNSRIICFQINNMSIQDMHIFGDPSRIPVVIVEQVITVPLHPTSGNSNFAQMEQKDTNSSFAKFCSNPTNPLSRVSSLQNGRVLKIVVFVHGFQGHHLDLRLIRNQWLLIDPKIEFLMSEANEDKTSGDFREMGERLAREVVTFVKKKMDKVSRCGVLRTIKLSFVGHSIGNLILRTALADSIMEPYLEYLHTFLSLSGPHLGYLYSSNSLFNGGLWLMKKLNGAQCIHQLTFTDSPDLQNTFLYKLCKQKTLDNFKNVILLSSPQDGYVPYHSARIEACPASSTDESKKGKIFQEMLNECLDQLRASSSENRVLMRCDVDFDVSLQGKSLDTIIGRAAHIEFLDSDIFVRFIMWSFPELFR